MSVAHFAMSQPQRKSNCAFNVLIPLTRMSFEIFSFLGHSIGNVAMAFDASYLRWLV